MIKCANCGCENLKDAKECVQCRCILLKWGVSFKPATMSISQKRFLTFVGFVFLVFGLYISSSSFSSSYYDIFMDDSVSIFYLIMSVILSICSGFFCYFVVFLIHFSVKHAKSDNDISEMNKNN